MFSRRFICNLNGDSNTSESSNNLASQLQSSPQEMILSHDSVMNDGDSSYCRTSPVTVVEGPECMSDENVNRIQNKMMHNDVTDKDNSLHKVESILQERGIFSNFIYCDV